MERIRAFERTAEQAAVRDQLVLGAIHLSIGQEAVAAGLVGALRRDDLMVSTHRGHGHTLAKGADPAAMMKELLGRQGGCCGGKGGSMHIADFGVGMLGANGVVSANITIGAGAAHGVKLLGDDRIVVDIFGDGAINRGPFLEGLNWAAVFGLPVLFVCEDNEWSATTRTADMTAGDGAGARARAIGLPVEVVDGNDAEAVADVARSLVARVRDSRAPAFLHARTFRQGGHTYFDPASYRSADDTAARIASDDPIDRQRAALGAAGVADADLDRLRSDAEAEMAAALEAAKAAPFPDADQTFTDVQDIGAPEAAA
ncbi:thiamine pyrophosphate-dependent dehydrogenase E1 component subunit alpha [Rhodobacteraceae bacterium CCMM004]|nr:thiamine pyrophosphate-dependent dehydrogenase E1 component subunit alpha [Rhodobacteraceae bacterium CCMM004]